MKRKALLNTTNLHAGGGVQVAASVISEIAKSSERQTNLALAISTEVERGVGGQQAVSRVFGDVFGLDVFGVGAGNRRAKALFDRYEHVFTVFGPLYRWNPPFRSIVGFAQPWIIYPRNEVYMMLPWYERIKTRALFWIHAQFFKRADMLVVELEHVKVGLIRELGIAPERIHVVHNCVSALYSDEAQWQPVSMPDTGDALRLGFLGRNYVHKNTGIFPELVAALRVRHGIEARVFVTFTEEEWRACSPAFRATCVNVGPLDPAQCPNFYQALDAVVFPSLLECFSATPLEAMAMGRPLFAADRPFNRDICGDHARYFDPLSSENAADVIAQTFKIGGPDATALTAARRHALSFSNPQERKRRYMALLEDNVETTKS